MLNRITLITWAALGLLILLAVLAFVNSSRRARKWALSDEMERKVGADLLDYVKSRSRNRKQWVQLSPFWRKLRKDPKWGARRTKWPERTALVTYLARQGHVNLAAEPERNVFWDLVVTLWTFAFSYPPSSVQLTDLTWELMVRDNRSGMSLIIGSVGTVTIQNQDTGGGNIVNSPQAGRDADVQAGDVNGSIGKTGLSAADLLNLVNALRVDARAMPSGGEKNQVRKLANQVEDEATADAPEEDAVSGMLQQATKYVSEFGGAMGATSRLLETWQRLRGHL